MNHKSTLSIPEHILHLQQQLDQFRSSQPRRTKLLEPLWRAAVERARQHGVYPVAHQLRLDYVQLKKRLGGVPSPRRKAHKPAFVEVVPPRSAVLEDCVMEFEPSSGGKIRIQWKAPAPPIGLACCAPGGMPSDDSDHGVFRSRSGTAFRLFSYDGQGYWLAQKRLSKGRLVWWPEAIDPTKPLEAYEAQLLMAAGDLSRVRAAPMWRRVNAPE